MTRPEWDANYCVFADMSGLPAGLRVLEVRLPRQLSKPLTRSQDHLRRLQSTLWTVQLGPTVFIRCLTRKDLVQVTAPDCGAFLHVALDPGPSLTSLRFEADTIRLQVTGLRDISPSVNLQLHMRM